MRRALLLAASLVVATRVAAQTQPATPPAAPEPTTPGRVYAWGTVGPTFAYGNTYGSLGLGVGYRMPSNLAPNVELTYNFGPEPTFWTLRPGVTWFIPISLGHPFIGGYLTHWFVNDAGDRNGIGARAGFSIGRILSFAITYDHAIGCSQSCDLWTPSLTAGITL
jgi:hypothetical protein